MALDGRRDNLVPARGGSSLRILQMARGYELYLAARVHPSQCRRASAARRVDAHVVSVHRERAHGSRPRAKVRAQDVVTRI